MSASVDAVTASVTAVAAAMRRRRGRARRRVVALAAALPWLARLATAGAARAQTRWHRVGRRAAVFRAKPAPRIPMMTTVRHALAALPARLAPQRRDQRALLLELRCLVCNVLLQLPDAPRLGIGVAQLRNAAR